MDDRSAALNLNNGMHYAIRGVEGIRLAGFVLSTPLHSVICQAMIPTGRSHAVGHHLDSEPESLFSAS